MFQINYFMKRGSTMQYVESEGKVTLDDSYSLFYEKR